MTNISKTTHLCLGTDAESEVLPGHWLLARLGKRVLRPGGLGMTRAMLNALDIDDSDDVVEFAPGLGITTALALERAPKSYTAVERDPEAARRVSALMNGTGRRCIQGCAEDTGLPARSASVVYGEAMLSMHADALKQDVIAEAARILKPGGRYGLHEICLCPDDLDTGAAALIKKELTRTMRVGVRPCTIGEWRAMLETRGFRVLQTFKAPFALLEPGRLLCDEGVVNSLRIIVRALRDGDARARVLAMRSAIWKHRHHLSAVTVVAGKE